MITELKSMRPCLNMGRVVVTMNKSVDKIKNNTVSNNTINLIRGLSLTYDTSKNTFPK